MRRSNKFQLLKILAVGAAILMLVVSVATWLDQPYNLEIDELPHERVTTLKHVSLPPKSTTKKSGEPPPRVLIQNKYAGIILKKFTYYKDNMNKQVMLYQMSDQEKADYAKDHFNLTHHKHNLHNGSLKRRRKPGKGKQQHDSNEGGEVVDDDEEEDQPNQHAQQYDEESEGEREDYDDEEAAKKLAELHPKEVENLSLKFGKKTGHKNGVIQDRGRIVKPASGRKNPPIKKQLSLKKVLKKSGHLNRSNVKKPAENEEDDAHHGQENEESTKSEEVDEKESDTAPKSLDPRKQAQKNIASQEKEVLKKQFVQQKKVVQQEAVVPQEKIVSESETHKVASKKTVENVKEQPKNYKKEPRIDKSQTKKKHKMISPETKEGLM